jgi:hypothetical protein
MLMMHYGKSNINGHVIGYNGEIDTGNFPKIVRKKWVKWLSEWKDYISNH